MILKNVYIRFYRAFNFDYLRARHEHSVPEPWDLLEDGRFYPYIRLSIEDDLTCIVGANESGKSQVLQAIEIAIGDEAVSPAGFCRYSDHFTVASAMKTPHFGLHFTSLSDSESNEVKQLAGATDEQPLEEFWLFRSTHNKTTIYFSDREAHEVSDSEKLGDLLPTILRIEPGRALPNSVPISYLSQTKNGLDPDDALRRTHRWALHDSIGENAVKLLSQLGSQDEFRQSVQSIVENLQQIGSPSQKEENKHLDRLELARDLLITVGGIDPTAFVQLREALRNEDEGLANGIEASMNAQLEQSLDLAKWWSQDQLFRVAISVRDYDLVFTVRDRTGSEYSFAERSSGLKYFLSYLVQFLTHLKTRGGHDILLMDEPDAYLSNDGQQDLLRLLQEFTVGADGKPGGQVVFVTHSPFLIDKNRADRLRVLNKGSGDEGARVVRDVGRNHFEPLRTALGSFVGETAFIGNCNLIVEGVADQIYLAGMSSELLKRGYPSTNRFDLNRLTLVPAGGAGHIPYMTFLARGRDVDRPAVVVLLDGDSAGDDAAKGLRKGGPKGKQVLDPKYIARIGKEGLSDLSSDRPDGPRCIEDLIPVEIASQAARSYAKEMGIELTDGALGAEDVRSHLDRESNVLRAAQIALGTLEGDLSLEKIGFARHVLNACEKNQSEAAIELCTRFAALFAHLTILQRGAERERTIASVASRVDREVKRFFLDHQHVPVTKAQLKVLLENIVGVVDVEVEGDAVMTEIRRISSHYDLEADLSEQITDMADLRERLKGVKYSEVRASQPEAQPSLTAP